MALREIHRSGAEAPVSPAPGAAEHGKVRLRYRGYVYVVTSLSRVANRLREYREAANDPDIYEQRRTRKALMLVGSASGLLTLGVAAEIAKQNGVDIPAVSDIFNGGQFGSDVADCVKEKAANLPPTPTDPAGNPIAEPSVVPGVPINVFDACVAEVQARNGK